MKEISEADYIAIKNLARVECAVNVVKEILPDTTLSADGVVSEKARSETT